MGLRVNRWLITGAVAAAVLGLAGFGLGAASASNARQADDPAASTTPTSSVTPASSPTRGDKGSGESATPLADVLGEPGVQAFLDCLAEQGVTIPEITDGNFSLDWTDGKLTINGTVVDPAVVADAMDACEAQLPAMPALPDLGRFLEDLGTWPDLEGLEGLEGLEDLGRLGEFAPFVDPERLADCLAEKGYDFPFGKGVLPGGWFGHRADASALITILERTADALRHRLDADPGSDVEQRLAALEAAIEALKADAAAAPADPTGPPDPTGLREALESCRAELAGD